jgi:glycosyltransferase involved in cell wall biosynthesis
MASEPITILMGLYNGAEHLAPQLQSFADQSDPEWRLLVSDDGSRDGSVRMVTEFARTVTQDVQIMEGPRRGFAANYMAMIAGLAPEPGLICFADQDDIWLGDKLARARAHLAATEPDIPTLYCAARWIWQAESDHRQATPLPRRMPSFRNALIENIAPGNTVVLNPAAARLARAAAARTGDVFAHDWWLYLLITGAGGRVVVDHGPPCLLYRQHGGNAIGGETGAAAQIRRKIKVLQGAFRDRLTGNLAAMLAVEDLLTPQNAQLMKAFAAARGDVLTCRLRRLARVAPYRQTSMGTLGFWGAALLGRV